VFVDVRSGRRLTRARRLVVLSCPALSCRRLFSHLAPLTLFRSPVSSASPTSCCQYYPKFPLHDRLYDYDDDVLDGARLRRSSARSSRPRRSRSRYVCMVLLHLYRQGTHRVSCSQQFAILGFVMVSLISSQQQRGYLRRSPSCIPTMDSFDLVSWV